MSKVLVTGAGGFIGSHLVEEYWVDIGQIDEYRRANADFASIF